MKNEKVKSTVPSTPEEVSARSVPKQSNGVSGTGEVAKREEEMLAFWNEHDIFNTSVETPAGKAPVGDFVFYDGPPFATGLPHYGHILAGTIKDAIPRFWTMNGYRVKRKWGWDCHGLPLENIIEKKLGLATKRDIEELGVKQFNEAAREAVLEYADDWRRIVPRMGRFVDMDDDYKTMDASYTESVWWVFSELNKKGLVYEGFKSMHLCPRCGTTLSNFEVNQGYKDIKDIAVTVKLPLLDNDGKVTDTSLLVWTTTPWTLPGNMAAAVHNDIEYVQVKIKNENLKSGEEIVILAKARLVQLGTDAYEILESIKGNELVGRSYQPPFEYLQLQEFSGKENAWKIYHADYVELGEEGTGAVHLAPAYGEEDMNLAKAHNIPIMHHVDHDGHFMSFVTDFAGQLVKPKDDEGVSHLDADIKVLKKLQENEKCFAKENITHSYPHCWRCDTPLLNYATTSWFVRVTDIKDALVEENSKVQWVPEHVGRARFGKWLEGARDWAISRQRYWGAPLPIWKNEITKQYKVFGSLADIKQFVPKSGNSYLLIRHGEAESNKLSITNTQENAVNPLTPEGRIQVRESAQKLMTEGADLIIASPFMRTKETAEIISAELNLPKEALIFDTRIGEISLGEMDGCSVEEYHAFLRANGGWHIATPQGGESWSDVARRVGAFLYDIETKYQGKKILIVAHNSPLRMLGAVSDGAVLGSTAYDHDEHGKIFKNAEIRPLAFTPIPHNDNYELDFHRPYIDEIVLRDEDGTPLVRVPDVFDCWFESGSMPYAQNHYPFKNLETFNAEKGISFPAQFIAESIDQTRGWFYSMMVIGVGLLGKSPYEHVITNGLVLAEDGKKMSKKLQNYPDPIELTNRVGADAIRFYMLSSPIIKGEDLNFSEKEVLELQRKNIGRLHNVLAMYELFADVNVHASDASTHVLDRWMIARLNETIRDITLGYKSYELDKATRPIEGLIDDLSVWYLRRSRERLKNTDEADKNATLATLRFVLKNLALVMAPVMPFYAEYLFQRIREQGESMSVHLMGWPAEEVADVAVVEEMTMTREIVTLALEKRAKADRKVRQPLSLLTVSLPEGFPTISDEYRKLVESEVNVKKILFQYTLKAELGSYHISGNDIVLDTEITPELKREGDVRELIRAIQELRKTQGLNPQDRVVLHVSEATRGLLTGFESEVQAVVGATDIQVGDSTTESITIGEQSFQFGIVKV